MVLAYFQTIRQFGRDVRLYFFIAALMGFTYDGGIYAVLFNLYLLRIGFGPEVIGQVNSAGMLAFALSAFPAGAIGQKLGNRRAIVMGIFIMLLGSLWVPFTTLESPAWQTFSIYLANILLNLGLALFYVNATPYLIAITQPQARNHAFSMQSALISLAGFIGGLLAGFLPGYFAATFAYTLDDPAPYRYPLLIAAVLIGLGAFATTLMRDIAPLEVKRVAEPASEPAGQTRSVLWLIFVLSFVRLLVVSGSGVAMTFFNVYMDAGLGVSTATIGVLMSASRLLAVPAALMTPILVHRLGNARVTLLASLALSLCLLPLAFSSWWPVAGLGYMSTIAFTSVRYPAFTVYTMEITPSGWRATMSGAGEMAAGLSFAIIAFVGGLIIATHGYTLLFLAGSLLSVVGALILWLFMRFTRTQAA